MSNFSGQIVDRQPHRFGRARRHDIEHGFGLGQIEPSVQEGAQCELAGLRIPRAGRQHRPQCLLDGDRTTVAGDFDHILGGVAGRAAHPGEQCFVDNPFIDRIDHPAVEDTVRAEPRKIEHGATLASPENA